MVRVRRKILQSRVDTLRLQRLLNKRTERSSDDESKGKKFNVVEGIGADDGHFGDKRQEKPMMTIVTLTTRETTTTNLP
jgi:hypothetical protein